MKLQVFFSGSLSLIKQIIKFKPQQVLCGPAVVIFFLILPFGSYAEQCIFKIKPAPKIVKQNNFQIELVQDDNYEEIATAIINDTLENLYIEGLMNPRSFDNSEIVQEHQDDSLISKCLRFLTETYATETAETVQECKQVTLEGSSEYYECVRNNPAANAVIWAASTLAVIEDSSRWQNTLFGRMATQIKAACNLVGPQICQALIPQLVGMTRQYRHCPADVLWTE